MYEATEWCDIGLVPVASQEAGTPTKRRTAMLSPTVTELTRGTAHPESQASQIILVALSLGPEPSVATARRIRETAVAQSDLHRRPDALARLARGDEGSSASHHASHTSNPAQWRGLQAA
jgi:hypothetical protein